MGMRDRIVPCIIVLAIRFSGTGSWFEDFDMLGANVHFINDNGDSALACAERSNHKEAVQVLRAAGSLTNMQE